MSNNIIINPLTQKPIKIGGRVYIQLVNDGILSAHNDLLENELDTYDDNDDAKEKINDYNEILKDKNMHAVKGRGKHENKIVTRRKKPTINENVQLGRHYKPTPQYVIHDEDNDELSEIDMNDLLID